ncbi:DHA2 family efflux MFS transporter permease subunit [Burkholderia plantarii]|uniref:Drug resistance transporter EmrB/QacA subfamily n=1 Tax=Burkholderia plantarii TaxID=41899 RepID=A0A0B6S7U7_BURPL|nr:DHA2 family efflux MFS transporter permease subunit [Burkholderia plantarii]AJK50514.1 drug resistance transporter EmrB/QacA subfamily [Burkholderia plantarii]ALK34693.1 major facilitator superfamily multidrug efflux transporter [Burkholderia plantarii]GLZ22306.1 MFS transporter [Burkholderia plantarii]
MTRSSSQSALLWIVAAGFFMQALDTTIVNTALPSIARAFGEDTLSMRSIVVAYVLTMAILTPASGWLADRYGTRSVYFAAILVFAIGSLACAGSQTSQQLVIARIVQGVGGSMLLPVGRLAVLRSVPGEGYVTALAFISVAGQVGPIIGPTLGGWFAQSLSWRWIFFVNVPIGALGLLAVRRYLPSDRLDERRPFDLVGCTLLSLAMLASSLALDMPARTARAAWIVAATLAAVCAVSGYLAHARRRAQPLFRLGLFAERNFGTGLVGNLTCRIGTSAVPFLLPLQMQLGFGYSPLHAGLVMLPAAVAGAVSKRWIAPLVRRFGYVSFLRVNTLIVGASILGFATLSPHTPLALDVLLLGAFGAATSMQFAAMNSVTLKDLSHRDASSGNGLFSMVQMLATSLGVSVGGGFASLLAGHRANGELFGIQMSFLLMGAITLASTFVFGRLDLKPAVAGTRGT